MGVASDDEEECEPIEMYTLVFDRDAFNSGMCEGYTCMYCLKYVCCVHPCVSACVCVCVCMYVHVYMHVCVCVVFH